MTDEGGGAADGADVPVRPRLSPRERLGVVQRRLLRDPRVREIAEVLQANNESGGPFLAAGLAFNAIFAITPALLFVVGMLGFVVGDAGRARDIVESLVDRVPALSGLVDELLTQLLAQRSAFSVVGIIGFLWGASGFYGGLDDAMRRLFPGGTARGPVEQRIRGVIAVVALVGAVLGALVAASLLSVLNTILMIPGGLEVLTLLGVVFTIAVFVAVVLVCYVVVPTAGPRVSIAFRPALVAGTAMGLLTVAFSLLTPYLVGQLAGLGVLAVVFVALVWLRLTFEILVWGAAWARVRRDRIQRRVAQPRLAAR